MPWLRTGDNAATHPRYLALFELPDVDAAARIATFGFVSLCATLSAAHMKDYLVSYGVAASVGHGAEALLLDIAVRAGLMEEVTIDGTQMWKIVDDPDFIHMRTKEEIEWERQRKNDNSRPDLTIPVRLRDGDACRYCARIVRFEPGARKGAYVGTYDHRQPKHGATVDTLVVACTACNAGRKDDPLADQRYPLLPPPPKPYYSPHTRKWLREHEWARDNGYSITSRRGRTIPPGTVPDDRKHLLDERQRPATQADTATTATRQPAGHRDTTERTDSQSENAPEHHTTTATSHPVRQRETRRQRTGTQPDHASTTPPQRPTNQADNANTQHPHSPAQTPDLPDTADPAEAQPPTSGSAGSGRDGSGRSPDHPHPDETLPSRTRSLHSSAVPRRRGRRSKHRKTGH